MKYAKLADEDPQWTSGEQHVFNSQLRRECRGGVGKEYFGMFVLITRLTWHLFLASQRGDKTNPNPFLPMSQRTRRRRKRSDEILYRVMCSSDGIRWCVPALCGI